MLRHESQNKNAAFSDEKPQFQQHTEELLLSEDSEEKALPENWSLLMETAKGLTGFKSVCELLAIVASGLHRRVEEEG